MWGQFHRTLRVSAVASGPLSQAQPIHLTSTDRVHRKPAEERLRQEARGESGRFGFRRFSGHNTCRCRWPAGRRHLQKAKTLQKSHHVSKWWAQWWAHLFTPPTKSPTARCATLTRATPTAPGLRLSTKRVGKGIDSRRPAGAEAPGSRGAGRRVSGRRTEPNGATRGRWHIRVKAR